MTLANEPPRCGRRGTILGRHGQQRRMERRQKNDTAGSITIKDAGRSMDAKPSQAFPPPILGFSDSGNADGLPSYPHQPCSSLPATFVWFNDLYPLVDSLPSVSIVLLVSRFSRLAFCYFSHLSKTGKNPSRYRVAGAACQTRVSELSQQDKTRGPFWGSEAPAWTGYILGFGGTRMGRVHFGVRRHPHAQGTFWGSEAPAWSTRIIDPQIRPTYEIDMSDRHVRPTCPTDMSDRHVRPTCPTDTSDRHIRPTYPTDMSDPQP